MADLLAGVVGFIVLIGLFMFAAELFAAGAIGDTIGVLLVLGTIIGILAFFGS